ncbi:MAG: mechanosensitive ion channel [Planctomycetaceae bacterium]|nr:mechanosensitive ion channel [Planctomycetaceae bacterium]
MIFRFLVFWTVATCGVITIGAESNEQSTSSPLLGNDGNPLRSSGVPASVVRPNSVSDEQALSRSEDSRPVHSTGNEPERNLNRRAIGEESIKERIESISGSESLAEEAKSNVVERYKTALKWVQERGDVLSKIDRYQRDIDQASERVSQAKLQLSETHSISGIDIPADAELAHLEEQLNQTTAKLLKAQKQLVLWEEEVKGERKAELAKLIPAAKKRLESAKEQLESSAAADESAEMKNARWVELRTRIELLQQQIDLYNLEIRRTDALAEFFPLQRDLAKREKNAIEKHVTELQNRVAQCRRAESKRLAREARLQVEISHPTLKSLAERNAQLAEQRQVMAGKIGSVESQVTTTQKKLDSVRQAYRKANDSVEKASHSTTVGLMLQKQRHELPDTGVCQERIRFVETEMPVIHLSEMEFSEERSALADMDLATSNVMLELGVHQEDLQRPLLESTARDLLTTKRDLLDKLVVDSKAYVTDLTALEIGNRQLMDKTEEFAAFIDEHVLWIRSAERISVADVADAGQGLKSLCSATAWLDLLKQSGLDTLQQPWMAGAVLIVACLLIVFHRRLRARIRDLCVTKSYTGGLKFWPTIYALFLSAVVSAEWPVLGFFFGWRMTRIDHASAFLLAVGPALQYISVMLFLSEFVRELCRPQGVAKVYFDWTAHGTQTARRETWWLGALGLPLAGIVVFASIYQDAEWSNSLGRIAFILGMLVLAGYTHLMLGSKDHVLRDAIMRNPDSWLKHVRLASYLLGVGMSLSLAGLAAIGFYYSAQHLAVRLQATLGMVLATVLVHAILSRWFMIKRRALSMEQARERQQQQAELVESEAVGAPIPVNQGPDLGQIQSRLQLLLRHALTVSVFVASWLIWADVLPALKILDRVEFWRKSVQVVEERENSVGQVQAEKIWVEVPTTLRHGVIAALLLLATFALGKNLPALLEITVLKSLPFDRGGRHAISVILHYLVALTGLFLAGRTLNITWSSIQWLAAGMTVGLGFGLQEIFANCVSGLILLFERPIRVGDVITLGDVTGTVTNIRIRATTVTNWDRKELIVPNRELITGRLLNWTLSDTTNRIVINIGLAYATDAMAAREVILAAVKSHENVLTDPGPNVTFEGFGDSALNFVVRAYVASMEVRLSTVNDLHAIIHRDLQAEGIEIPFPQVDMNVRGLPPEAQPIGRSIAQRPEAA